MPGLVVTSLTSQSLFATFSRKLLAVFSVSKLWFKVAVISACSLVRNLPVTLNFALAANFSISCSRSTIRRRAGDCTRPAEIAPGTLRRTTPERSKPTSISRVWRACWDDTMSISTVRGLLMAASRAGLVISWKVMRFVPLGSFSTSMRCQEIASPSRSSSVASQIVSASAAAFLRSEMIFLCPGSIS